MKLNVIKKVSFIALITILIAIFSFNNISVVNANGNDENNIPTYFNLADTYNLKVENQGEEGNCWAFAALKSLETYLIMHDYGEYDFSEIHMSYLESNDFFDTKGSQFGRRPNTSGNFDEAMDYITRGYGPVLEEDFPYNQKYTVDDYDRFLNIEPVAYIGSYIQFPEINKEEYNRTDEITKENIRKQMKKHIMENGSIDAFIIAPQYFNDFYNEDTYAQYFPYNLTEGYSNGNLIGFEEYRHNVSIIGWDDNFSRENFNENNRPENDGAYIVLNSWGKEHGDDGVIYVSYEDKYVEKELFGITEASTNKDDIENLNKLQFNDNNLYKKLKSILKNSVFSYDDSKNELNLSNAAIKGLEVLDLSNSGITDISGLEAFNNVKELNLSGNNISDFSPMLELKELLTLKLKNCGITDLSNIFPQEYFTAREGKINIDSLDLSENNLSNLNILTNFAKIRELFLSNIGLTNNKLEELNGLKVNCLDISNNLGLTDVSAINNLIDLTEEVEEWQKQSLRYLDLSYNKNINTNTIPDNLEGLYLENMGLSNEDLGNINFSTIRILDLSYNNNITGFDNINDKGTIGELDLSGNTNIDINNLIYEFPRLFKLAYRNANLNSILPLLQSKDFVNEYNETIKYGIQQLDLDGNNIDLAENDFEQFRTMLETRWLNSVVLSHNKTTKILDQAPENSNFILDLSYNNFYPEFYTPSFIYKMDNQNYTGQLDINPSIINNFNDIGQNLVNIYNTRHSVGIQNILEIEGAVLDVKDKSFIVTCNPGEQVTIRINGGKYKDSIITYNINNMENLELLNILLDKGANKRIYIEGEDFDTSGIKLTGVYSNNCFSEITDYEIVGGTNLQPDQDEIIIKKDDKEIHLSIISDENDYENPNNPYIILVCKQEDVATISFEDKALYEFMCTIFKNIISKNDEEHSIVLPKTQLDKIYDLIITSDNIESLNGIENIFPNLQAVELHGKKFSNITALKGYNLNRLVIDNNEVLDNLDEFKDMDTLNFLTINNSKIININNLKSVTNLRIDSKTIPEYDEIADDLESIRISHRVQLSDLEIENNIYTLPDYIQEILNENLPRYIKEQMDRLSTTVKIYYILRGEEYLNNIKTEDMEVINDEGVWKIDLTDFIENNDIKNRYIRVFINVLDEYSTISNYNYFIYYDEAKILDHLEIESENILTFKDGEDISLENVAIYAVYSNGEREAINNYDINVDKAEKGLNSITITYSEDGIDCELIVPIQVIDNVEEEEETQDKYHIIETRNIVWIRDSGENIMVKSEAECEKFVRLIIGNDVVERQFYDVTNGSTIVDIKPEYLQTLDDGTYNYTLEFTDGKASGELMIKTEDDFDVIGGNIKEKVISPKTDDNIGNYIIIEILVMTCFALILIIDRKKIFVL